MTTGRYKDLIARLRYLDTYAKTDRHETTIFGQSADSIELLEAAVLALENLAADRDREMRKLRGDVQVRGEGKRHGVVPSVEELLSQIKALEKENAEMKKYIAEGAPGK